MLFFLLSHEVSQVTNSQGQDRFTGHRQSVCQFSKIGNLILHELEIRFESQ